MGEIPTINETGKRASGLVSSPASSLARPHAACTLQLAPLHLAPGQGTRRPAVPVPSGAIRVPQTADWSQRTWIPDMFFVLWVLFFLVLPLKFCPSPASGWSVFQHRKRNVLPTLGNLFLGRPSLGSELSRQNDVTLFSQQRDT